MLMAFPTRATNSSQARSSHGPALKETSSCRDNDEYRVGLQSLIILMAQILPSALGRFFPDLPDLDEIEMFMWPESQNRNANTGLDEP